jgi:hypothetical protein
MNMIAFLVDSVVDPELGAFLTPGSGIGFFFNTGSPTIFLEP